MSHRSITHISAAWNKESRRKRRARLAQRLPQVRASNTDPGQQLPDAVTAALRNLGLPTIPFGAAAAVEEDSGHMPLDPIIEENDDGDVFMAGADDGPPPVTFTLAPPPPPPPRQRNVKRVATPKKQHLYTKWNALLPRLRQPLLDHAAGNLGPPFPECHDPSCRKSHRRVTCVSWDHFEVKNFTMCSHRGLPEQLVRAGFFPSSPEYPTYAFSLKLLDFYFHLWFHSADSATAAAAALHDFHADLGFVLTDAEGKAIDEGYRRPLQYSIQWYDLLRSQIDTDVQAAINASRRPRGSETTGSAESTLPSPPPSPRHSLDSTTTPKPFCAEQAPRAAAASAPTGAPAAPTHPGNRTAAAGVPLEKPSPYLVSRCPCCFNEERFGRTLAEGLDFHIAGDANFSHRHNAKAGDCPPIAYDIIYQIESRRVEEMEARLTAAGKRPTGQYKGGVPDAALDACRDSHTAGSSSKHKSASDKFDDKGLMALVCRHDIPLCFVNVTDPGEGQKYMLASLEWLFEHLPSTATVAAFYDVGCITDRTRQLYDVLPEGVSERVVFATSAMHAYAHQWACQLMYNPRMKGGMGLSDGEGTERLWSALRMLIPVLRVVSRQRRPLLIDRHLVQLGRRMRDGLPQYLRRRAQTAAKKKAKATAELALTGYTREYLEVQFGEQKSAETSVRSQASTRLKKCLESVLALQEQVDMLDQAIDDAQASIPRSRSNTTAANRTIRQLKASQTELVHQAQELHATLQIPEEFEEIRGLGLQVTALLLQAHEAKRIVRALLVKRYQEWDRLDSSAGGKGPTVGTHLHQRTVNAMQKRTPAIQKALKDYNGLCRRLRELVAPTCTFPLPEELSLDLKHLRNNDDLMRDVYIAAGESEAPHWLIDADVRKGIRAIQTQDRCQEEEVRLTREWGNLCQWYADEQRAVDSAALSTQYIALRPFLAREKYRLSCMDFRGRRLGQATRAERVQIPEPRDEPQIQLQTPEGQRRVRFAPDAVVFTIPARGDMSEEYDTDDELEELAPQRATLAGRGCDEGRAADAAIVISDSDSDSDGDDDEVQEGITLPPPPPGYLEAMSVQAEQLPHIKTPAHYWHDWTDARAKLPSLPPHHIESPLAMAATAVNTGLIIQPESWRCLMRSTGWFSDEIILAAITVLLARYTMYKNRFAVLSPYEMTRYRDGLDVRGLFRHLSDTKPWRHEGILVPINERRSHWTVAVVWPSHGYVEIFDSLADMTRMRTQATMVARYFASILAFAHAADSAVPPPPAVWKWTPVLVDACQSNGWDCGIWILAHIVALLHGRRCSAMKEDDTRNARYFVGSLIYSRCTVASPVPSP